MVPSRQPFSPWRNHCLPHSGARYCVTDQGSAKECIAENMILRRIMPDLFELYETLSVFHGENEYSLLAKIVMSLCYSFLLP